MSIATDRLQRLLFEHSTDAVAILDARAPSFPIVEANHACYALLGQPPRALTGQPGHALFAQGDTRAVIAIFARVVASGEPFHARDFPAQRATTAGNRRPGERRYWDWRCLPLPDAFGGIERLVILIGDVTEQRRQRRGRLLNRQIVAQAPLGVLVTSGPDHRVILVSPRLARLGALAPARMISHPALAALPALADAGLAPILDEVYTSGTPRAIEEFALHPDGAGEAIIWNLTILPLPGLEGATEGLMLMAADLTAQVRARQETAALAATTQRRARELESVIGAIAEGVCLLDAAGRLLEANEAGLRLLGLAAPAAGQRLLEILVGLDLQWEDGRPLHAGDALLQRAFCGQQPLANLVLLGPFPSSRRRRYFSLTISPVAGDGDQTNGAVVILREITAQKQAEQETDAFLALIAHEVKSPLTAIKGFAQLARRAENAGNERIRRHLDVIEQQAARIGGLVDGLSEVGRLQRGKLRDAPVRCDLAALVRTTVEHQRVVFDTRRITLAILAGPTPIHVDPLRIEQVVVNLLGNAAKYSPADAPIAVTVTRAEHNAQLTVRDSGVGIPGDELDRIFDRFYRASNGAASSLGGLGLGLYVSREIVAHCGGAIWAESIPGEGSAFHVSLPLAEEAAP